jgi:hypothetical protein
MAATCLVVAFMGFAPMYWLQLTPGTFIGTPLLHLHGVLFSAWPLYLLVQTTLAARGHVGRHRTTPWWFAIADFLARFSG